MSLNSLKFIIHHWRFSAHMVLLLAAAHGIPCNAQSNNSERDTINWVYQSSIGGGVSIGTQENASIYKLPFSYRLRRLREYGWGLKLKFPLTVGLYNIEIEDRDIDLDVLAIFPGVEFQLPIRSNWILMPFLNFGIGKVTSDGDLHYLYTIGAKHHLYVEWKALDFTGGNTLQNDGNFADINGDSDDFSSLSTYLDMRFPLGFSIFDKAVRLSIYGVHYHYFDNIVVIDSESKTIEINTQWELGTTISTIPSWKIWFFTIERIGLGYRFGDGFSTIRLVFGLPF